MRIFVGAVLALCIAVSWYAVDAAHKARFPTTDFTIDEINARDTLVNTTAAVARAAQGETVPLRVLFYGQSIMGSGWPSLAMADLQARHPNIAFQWENRA